jgi:uncharacterized protein Yka (UPF0111/DUF47 family)
MTGVKPKRSWFFPETPDVLGMLRHQAAITVDGMDALCAWAAGDATAADRLRDREHDADQAKRELRVALRTAFITPIGAEDIYVLSQRLDDVLNAAKDAVREAEVLAMSPDEAIVGMSALLSEGVHDLSDAFAIIASTGNARKGADPTEAADRAVKAQRQLERVYRNAMVALLEVDDLKVVMGRRELYRRFSRMSASVQEVADRVWYAAVKEA